MEIACYAVLPQVDIFVSNSTEVELNETTKVVQQFMIECNNHNQITFFDE